MEHSFRKFAIGISSGALGAALILRLITYLHAPPVPQLPPITPALSWFI